MPATSRGVLERMACRALHEVKTKGVTMVVKLFKCQMCGTRFEVEVLDQDDPRERNQPGAPVRCPKCGSTQIEAVRTLRYERAPVR